MLARVLVVVLAGGLVTGCEGEGDAVVEDDAALTDGGSFNVTVIGDSHSDFAGGGGHFGRTLVTLMTERSVPVSHFAASSSAPNWWLDDTAVQAATWGYTQTASTPPMATCSRGGRSGPCVPKLGAILHDRPSLLVIEQGTNLFGRTDADVTHQVRKMLQQIAGKTDACLWLGAPRASTGQHSEREQADLWQLIVATAAPTCFVYDSRFVPRAEPSGEPMLDPSGNLIVDVPLEYAGPDGVHFQREPASRWARGVAIMIDWIRTQAAGGR